MANKQENGPGCLASLFGYTILACIIALMIDLAKSKLTPKMIHNIKIAAIIVGILFILYLVLIIYKKINRKYSIRVLDKMEGHDFEYACADILRTIGYHNVKVTKSSGDYGVDILAEKKGNKYAIQCKRYSSKLGNSPIQEVVAGMNYYGCSKGAVMTNQYFTESAKKLAEINCVELWDRATLEKMISKNKHLNGPTTTAPTRKRFKVKKRTINSPTTSNTHIFEESTNDSQINQDQLLKYSDPKTPDAIKIIAKYQNSERIFIQRKLMLGYPHVDEILNEIESLGFIGPKTTNPRSVYITKNDLPQILNNLYYTPISNKTIQTNPPTANFAEQTAREENLKANIDLLSNFLQDKVKYILYFYLLENVTLEFEDFSFKYETNEVDVLFHAPKKARISLIKSKFKELQEYIHVDYVKYIYPTTIPYTFAFRIPMPEYAKEISQIMLKNQQYEDIENEIEILNAQLAEINFQLAESKQDITKIK